MKYRFEKDYDHHVRDEKHGTLRATVSYKAGHEGTIPHAHAEAANAAGVGKVVEAGPNPSGEGFRCSRRKP